jgi:nicotinamidase-related amidase
VLVPPATAIDKHVYSPFFERRLRHFLQEQRVDGMVITRTEADVCVLATVLRTIDFGYAVAWQSACLEVQQRAVQGDQPRGAFKDGSRVEACIPPVATRPSYHGRTLIRRS